MKPHQLEYETRIDAPLTEVFDFFSRAENLQALTPPYLHFKILTPLPIVMGQGILIDYQIKLLGIPFKWRTEISVWEPPMKFVDRQLAGPYAHWVHTHEFRAEGNLTYMKDTIAFRSPGGRFLEWIPHLLFVKRSVNAIFQYRQQALNALFPAKG